MIQFVIWPDGKKRRRPKDGEKFAYNGKIYTWDDTIDLWVNARGEVVRFEEKEDSTYSSMYGYYDGYIDGFSEPQEPKKKEEQTEGDKLKDFFFPHKNTEGCECGTWVTGSPKHSKSCKLYKEE